ncbi:OmpH family outer membrane protein [Profundibacter sp.]
MGIRGGILAALLAFGPLGAMAPPLLAQDNVASQRLILTIDQDQLFTGSLFGERVAAEIKQDLAVLEKDFQRIEAALTAEEKDLTQRRQSLAPDVFRVLADEFDVKVQGIRKAQDAKARALDARHEAERARYYGLVNPILYEMMDEIGAMMILDRRAILMGAEGVDITNDALQVIDATLGDGAVVPKPPDE